MMGSINSKNCFLGRQRLERICAFDEILKLNATLKEAIFECFAIAALIRQTSSDPDFTLE